MKKQPVIICDIDGTVADLTNRLHWIRDEIKVGDIVRPIGIPNAKEYRGTVVVHDKGTHKVTVDWNKSLPNNWPKFGPLPDYNQLKKVKNWRAFYEECDKDLPIQKNIDIVLTLAQTYPVIFMSGRPITYLPKTFKWFLANSLTGLDWAWGQFKVPTTTIHMRGAGDQRDDYIVKQELYEKHIEPYYDVVVWIDDRDQVVNHMRKLGVNVWQVCDGNY